jgi:hypothetical protein
MIVCFVWLYVDNKHQLVWHLTTNTSWFDTWQQTPAGLTLYNKHQLGLTLDNKHQLVWHLTTNTSWFDTWQQTQAGLTLDNKHQLVWHLTTNTSWFDTWQQTQAGLTLDNKHKLVWHLTTNTNWFDTCWILHGNTNVVLINKDAMFYYTCNKIFLGGNYRRYLVGIHVTVPLNNHVIVLSH